MLQGINKPSVKRVRKNYLPPFEDKGWTVIGDSSLIRDFVKNGYEVSYNTVNDSRYMGMTYKLPISLAGKTVSISVQEVKGLGGEIQLTWYNGSTPTNKGVMFKYGDRIQNIQIPKDVTSIYFKIQNSISNTGSYYFKGLQLEEGTVSTEFEEMYYDSKTMLDLVPKKNMASNKAVEYNSTFSGLETTQEGDWIRLTYNGTAYADSFPIKLQAGMPYTLTVKAKADGVSKGRIALVDNVDKLTWMAYSNDNISGTAEQFISVTYTPPRDMEVTVRLYTGRDATNGSAYYKEIQLEEGSIATPFEPRELVKKMSSRRSVAKKNLLISKHSSPQSLSSHLGSSNRVVTSLVDGGVVTKKYYELSIDKQTLTDNYYVLHGDLPMNVFKLYKLKPNTTYTLSSYIKTDGSGVLGFIKGILFNKQGSVYSGEKLGNSVSSTSWNRSSVTFTTDDNISGVLIRLQVPVTGLTGKVSFDGLQLEEGGLTSFEPYIEVNKRSIKRPKKNIFDKSSMAFKVGAIDGSTGQDHTSFLRFVISSGLIPVIPNTTYVYNRLNSDYGFIKPYGYNAVKGYLGDSSRMNPSISGDYARITTPANCYFIRVQFNYNSNDYIIPQSEVDNYNNIAQIEAGNIATSYESYKYTNKAIKSRTAPMVKYPNITFKRDSVETFEGVRYLRNQPRLSRGGVMMEEELYNFISSPSTVSRLEVVGNYYDQDTYVHTHPLQNKTETVDRQYNLSFDIKKYDNVSPKYFSSIVVGGVVNGDSWNVRLQGYSMDRFTVTDLGDGWKRMSQTFTINANTQYLQSFIKFIVDKVDTGIVCDVKNVQLIERPYELNFSPVFRPKEILRLPKGIVDSVKGSVEFTYIPAYNQVDFKKRATVSRGYLSSSQGSFRIWCWGTGASHVINVEFNSKDSNNATVRNNIDVASLGEDYIKRGVPIRFKFEWSPEQVAVEVDNHRYTRSVTGTFINVTASDVILGSDYQSLTEQNNMNGIYKNVVFKDRDGKTTFQL